MLRIGVVVDVVGRFGRGVLEGVTDFSLAHGEIELVIPQLYSFARQEEWDRWQIDGMVVQLANRAMAEQIAQRKMPAVNVSTLLEEPGIPTVTIDNDAVGRMAAEYLMERGFHHMAFLDMRSNTRFVRERGDAFMRRTAEAGIESQRLPRCPPAELVKWLRAMPRPMGIFTASDSMAKEALDACHEAGVSVPEHAALLGCDNDEMFYRRTRPALSSIALPVEKVGFEAARTLTELLAGKKVPALTRFEPQSVITRQSTDVLAITDEAIAEAMRYIRLNAHKGIRISDVLEVVPMSRRVLERRFRAATGRTVLAEILRVQLDLAQRLLAETDLAMPAIAERCGFNNATYLGIAFRRRLGRTPTAHRRQFRIRVKLGETAA